MDSHWQQWAYFYLSVIMNPLIFLIIQSSLNSHLLTLFSFFMTHHITKLHYNLLKINKNRVYTLKSFTLIELLLYNHLVLKRTLIVITFCSFPIANCADAILNYLLVRICHRFFYAWKLENTYYYSNTASVINKKTTSHVSFFSHCHFLLHLSLYFPMDLSKTF